jgi:hypothetical protein
MLARTPLRLQSAWSSRRESAWKSMAAAASISSSPTFSYLLLPPGSRAGCGGFVDGQSRAEMRRWRAAAWGVI